MAAFLTSPPELRLLLVRRPHLEWVDPDQPFSAGVLQKLPKHAEPDYLARGTDLFPLGVK